MTPHDSKRLRRILYAAAFLRALGVGLMAVLIGLYAARVGLSATQIGIVLSSALWGAALAAFVTLVFGPRMHERTLLVHPVRAAGAGRLLVFLSTDALWLLAVRGLPSACSTFTGATAARSPSSSSRYFPATATDASARALRLVQRAADLGYACGGLLAALPALFEAALGLATVDAMPRRSPFLRALCRRRHPLYASAAARCGCRAGGTAAPVAREPAHRRQDLYAFLHRPFGGGFIARRSSRIFFAERFGASAAQVAVLFAVGRLLSASSHLAAAWLAKRIGLINTMVYTHVPSSLLLFTIVAVDDFAVAAFFFLLREALNEMDVLTRQSYVMAVVAPGQKARRGGDHRARASGGWASHRARGVMMSMGASGAARLRGRDQDQPHFLLGGNSAVEPLRNCPRSHRMKGLQPLPTSSPRRA